MNDNFGDIVISVSLDDSKVISDALKIGMKAGENLSSSIGKTLKSSSLGTELKTSLERGLSNLDLRGLSSQFSSVRRELEAPIKLNINTGKLNELKSDLKKISDVNVVVKQNKSQSTFDSKGLESTIEKSINKGFKSIGDASIADMLLAPFKVLGKGVEATLTTAFSGVANIAISPFKIVGSGVKEVMTGALQGVGKEISNNFAKSFVGGLESNFSQIFGSFDLLGEKAGSSISGKLLDLIGNNLAPIQQIVKEQLGEKSFVNAAAVVRNNESNKQKSKEKQATDQVQEEYKYFTSNQGKLKNRAQAIDEVKEEVNKRAIQHPENVRKLANERGLDKQTEKIKGIDEQIAELKKTEPDPADESKFSDYTKKLVSLSNKKKLANKRADNIIQDASDELSGEAQAIARDMQAVEKMQRQFQVKLDAKKNINFVGGRDGFNPNESKDDIKRDSIEVDSKKEDLNARAKSHQSKSDQLKDDLGFTKHLDKAENIQGQIDSLNADNKNTDPNSDAGKEYRKKQSQLSEAKKANIIKAGNISQEVDDNLREDLQQILSEFEEIGKLEKLIQKRIAGNTSHLPQDVKPEAQTESISERTDKAKSKGKKLVAQPQIYQDIYAEVLKESGVDPSKVTIPELISNSKTTKGTGSYVRSKNIVNVDPAAYQKISEGSITDQDYDTLIHELRHSIQEQLKASQLLKPVSLEQAKRVAGRIDSSSSQYIQNTNRLTPQQKADMDIQSRSKIDATESDAYVFTDNKKAQIIQNVERKKLKDQAIEMHGFAGGKSMKINQVNENNELKGILAAKKASNVNVDAELINGLERIKESRAKLDPFYEQMLNIDILDSKQLAALPIAFAKQLIATSKEIKDIGQETIDQIQAKPEILKGENKANLQTLSKKEILPIAEGLGINGKNIKKSDLIDRISDHSDVQGVTESVNAVTRNKALKRMDRQEKLEDFGEGAGKVARGALGFGQQVAGGIGRGVTALSQSPLAQNAMEGAKGTALAAVDGGKMVYKAAQAFEGLVLDVIPMGNTIKSIGKNAVLPAALYGAATHMIPGGQAIAGGIEHLAQGAMSPIAQNLGQHLGGNAAGFIGDVLPNVMGISAKLGAGVNAGIVEGMASGGAILANAVAAIVGGKVIQGGLVGTAKAAIPEAIKQPLSLPASNQRQLKQADLVEAKVTLPEPKKLKQFKASEEVLEPTRINLPRLPQSRDISEDDMPMVVPTKKEAKVNNNPRQLKSASSSSVVNSSEDLAIFAEMAKEKISKVDSGMSKAYQTYKASLKTGTIAEIKLHKATLDSFVKRQKEEIDSFIGMMKDSGMTDDQLKPMIGALGGLKGRMSQKKNLSDKSYRKAVKTAPAIEVDSHPVDDTDIELHSFEDMKDKLDAIKASMFEKVSKEAKRVQILRRPKKRKSFEEYDIDANIANDKAQESMDKFDRTYEDATDNPKTRLSPRIRNIAMGKKSKPVVDDSMEGQMNQADIHRVKFNEASNRADNIFDLSDKDLAKERLLPKVQKGALGLLDKGVDVGVNLSETLKSNEAIQGLSGAFNTLKVAGLSLGALSFIAPLFAGFAIGGIAAAESMEKISTKMRFASGSATKAAEDLKYAKDTANRLGSNQTVAMDGYASLVSSTKGTNLEGRATEQIFKGLSEGGASRQLGKEEMKGAMLAIQQMSDKGTVSQEELRGQLSERLSGTMAVAARSRGQTVQEMNKDISTGTVTAEQFLPKMMQQLSAESALSLPSANKSSVAVKNRFDNTIEDVQMGLGASLLPARNAGLEFLTAGLQAIVAMGPLLVQIAGTLAAGFGFDLLKGLIKSGEGAKLLASGLRALGPLMSSLMSSMIKLAPQLLLFTVATEVFGAVKNVISDASGEMRTFADESAKGLAKYQELDDKFKNRNAPKKKEEEGLEETALVDGTMLKGLSKTYDENGSIGDKAGYGARWLLGGMERNMQGLWGGTTYAEKTKNDKLVAASDITGTAATTTNAMQSQLVDKDSALASLTEIDKEIERIQIKKRALVSTDPSDKEGITALKKEEDALREKQEKASMSVGALTAQNAASISAMQAQKKELEELASKPGSNQAEYIASLKNVTLELDAAEKTQRKFDAALKDGADSFTRFTTKMQTAMAKLNDATSKLKQDATVDKAKVNQEYINNPSLSKEQVQIKQASIDTSSLQKQVDNTAATIAEMSSLMESQNDVLTSYGINEKMGKEELGVIKEKAANPKDKKVIEEYSNLQELKNSQVSLVAELTNSNVAAIQQVRDTTKSIQDFFRGIKDQTKQIEIETKGANNKIAMTKAETKLKSTLLGFQDSFMTSYVDSLVGFLKALNKPKEDAIAAQGQILGIQQKKIADQMQADQLGNTIGENSNGENSPENDASNVGKFQGGKHDDIPTGTLAAQEYGASRSGGSRQHAGQDLDIGDNDRFQSYIGGKVTAMGDDPGGYFKWIDVYNDRLKKVERIAELDSVSVKVGDQIKPGQEVGKGTLATGVVHYEIRTDANASGQGGFGKGGTINPVQYLESLGIIKREGMKLRSINGANSKTSVKEEDDHDDSGNGHTNEYNSKNKTKSYSSKDSDKVLIQKTGVKDEAGLEKLLLRVIDKKGNVTLENYVNSGDPRKQGSFGKGGTTESGTRKPLEYGRYSIGQTIDSGIAGVGARFTPIEPEFKTERSALGIHYDQDRNQTKNGNSLAGSAGCVVFKTEKEYQEFQAALKASGINELEFRDGMSDMPTNSGKPKIKKTSNKQKTVSQSSNSGGGFDIDNFFKGGSNSLAAKVIGMAEGNRTATGGYTKAASGHIDPVNGASNIGSFSAQGNLNKGNIKDSDNAVIETMLKPLVTEFKQKASEAGVQVTPKLLVNYLDAHNQSPLAARSASSGPTFLNSLKDVKGRENDDGAILALRRKMYEGGGQYQIAGGTVEHDQNRRMQELNGGMKAFGVGSGSVGNSSSSSSSGESSGVDSDTTAAVNEANDQNRRVVAWSKKDIEKNSTAQIANVQNQLAATGGLDQLNAELEKQKTKRQFKTGLAEQRSVVVRAERQAEDIQAGIGYDTPQKQRAIQVRDTERSFYDQNLDLIKQLDEVKASKGQLEATIAVIKTGGFEGADVLQKDMLPQLVEGRAKLAQNLSRLEAVFKGNKKLKDDKLADILGKAQDTENTRVVGVRDEIQKLNENKSKAQNDLMALSYRPGYDPTRLKADSDIESKKSTFEVDMNQLDQQEKTGAKTKDEADTIRRIKKETLEIEIKLTEATAARDKMLKDREVRNKLFEGKANLVNAQADQYDAIGMGGAGKELRAKAQIEGLEMDLTKQLEDLDEYARATNLSAENLALMRDNAIALNSVKLDTLKAQMDPFQQIANTAKESFGGFFKDMLMGTKSIGEAFKDMVSNLLSKVADLAMNAMMNDLFSGGKGNGIMSLFGKKDKKEGLGQNLVADTTSSLLGSSPIGVTNPGSLSGMMLGAPKPFWGGQNGGDFESPKPFWGGQNGGDFESPKPFWGGQNGGDFESPKPFFGGQNGGDFGLSTSLTDITESGKVTLATGLTNLTDSGKPSLTSGLQTLLNPPKSEGGLLDKLMPGSGDMGGCCCGEGGGLDMFGGQDDGFGDFFGGGSDALDTGINNLFDSGKDVLGSSVSGLFGGGKEGGGLLGGIMGMFGGDSGGKSGGGLLGGILGIVTSLFSGGFYTGKVPNFADGNLIKDKIPNFADGYDPIGDAMRREGANSTGKPMLAVINDKELILSEKDTKKFYNMGLDKKINNYADGNMVSSVSGGESINVPVTVNASSGGPKPSIDAGAMSQAVKAAVIQEIQNQRRNSGLLSR